MSVWYERTSACGPLETRSSARRAARRAASGAPVAGVLLVGWVDGARSSRSAPLEEGCTLQQAEPRARDTRRAAPPRPRHAAPQPARTTSDTSASESAPAAARRMSAIRAPLRAPPRGSRRAGAGCLARAVRSTAGPSSPVAGPPGDMVDPTGAVPSRAASGRVSGNRFTRYSRPRVPSAYPSPRHTESARRGASHASGSCPSRRAPQDDAD